MNAIWFIGGGVVLTMGCFAYTDWVDDAEAQERFRKWVADTKAKLQKFRQCLTSS